MDTKTMREAMSEITRTMYAGLNQVTVVFADGSTETGMVREATGDPHRFTLCKFSAMRGESGDRHVDLRAVRELRVSTGPDTERVYR